MIYVDFLRFPERPHLHGRGPFDFSGPQVWRKKYIGNISVVNRQFLKPPISIWILITYNDLAVAFGFDISAKLIPIIGIGIGLKKISESVGASRPYRYRYQFNDIGRSLQKRGGDFWSKIYTFCGKIDKNYNIQVRKEEFFLKNWDILRKYFDFLRNIMI